MDIDNSIVVKRDYEHLRSNFLEEIKKGALRNHISQLGKLPYYYPQIFPKIKKRVIKRKVKLLQPVEPALGKMLFPGEEVRFVSSGVYHSLAEQYFLGWMSFYINRTVVICTNYRIVMINVDSKNRPLQMKWHIPYDQIKKCTFGSLFSSTVFKLTDNKKYVFSGFPRFDRTILKKYIPEMIGRSQQESFHLPHYECRDKLCTACFQPVKDDTYACEACGEQFVKPLKPSLMALFIPCLGDFYLRHNVLGAFELFGYIMTWLIFFLFIIGGGGLFGIVVFSGILIFEHVVDAVLTYYMANKGLVSVTYARNISNKTVMSIGLAAVCVIAGLLFHFRHHLAGGYFANSAEAEYYDEHYEEAIMNLERSLSYYEKVYTDQTELAEIYDRFAFFISQDFVEDVRLYHKARELYHKALAILDRAGESDNLKRFMVLFGIGVTYDREGFIAHNEQEAREAYQQAFDWYKEAIDEAARNQAWEYLSYIYYNTARIAELRGDLDDAIDYAQKCVAINRKYQLPGIQEAEALLQALNRQKK